MKLKNLIRMKLKNSNCDEFQKLNLWQNSKTQIGMKIKKTQIMIILQNSNCDLTPKPKL